MWKLCDRYGRDVIFAGMEGKPFWRPVKLADVLKIAEASGETWETVERVFMIEEVVFPLRYNK